MVVAKSRDGGDTAFPVTIAAAVAVAFATTVAISSSPAGCSASHPLDSPLVLSTRLRLSARNLGLSTPRRLLSAGACPPVCLSFAGWLLCCLLSCCLRLMSPFVM